MAEYVVVLVEPRVEGNVGAVARAMANFGFADLVLVNPCPLGDEAFRRSKHGRPILESARTAKDLDASLEGVDFVVGSTGISTTREKAFHRQSLYPWELAHVLQGVEGCVALLLGREDYGLYNEELDRLDILVNIPCNPDYPIMNISHAAAVLLYELHRSSGPRASTRPRQASGFEKERLHAAFHELLGAIDYPGHKWRRTEVMFRRLVGRATPSKWEFHALMGVLRGASKAIRRSSGSPEPGPSS